MYGCIGIDDHYGLRQLDLKRNANYSFRHVGLITRRRPDEAFLEDHWLFFGDEGIGNGVECFFTLLLYDFRLCRSFLSILVVMGGLSDFSPSLTASTKEAFGPFKAGSGVGARDTSYSAARNC